MKVAIIALLFTASAFAQNQDASPTAACGQAKVSFKVKLNDTPQTLTLPDPGKALIYFIHESGEASLVAYPTTKIALDGAWVGANHNDSFFFVSVDPGEHHICAALQSSFFAGGLELAHLSAEAGKTYFYRTRFILSRSVELLDMQQIDADQGRYLATSFPLSVSKPKK
jgi:hypothetical protein